FVVVIGLDENVTDEDPRQDRAKGKLEVSVISEREAFTGRTEECAGAGFRSDEGSENGPPRNYATTEREIFEIFLPSSHVKADGNDNDEVEEQNRAIDCESSVHVGA